MDSPSKGKLTAVLWFGAECASALTQHGLGVTLEE